MKFGLFEHWMTQAQSGMRERRFRPPWTIDDWCGKPGWPSATDMLTKTRGDVSQQI
jgi:hypothetical protein